MDNGKAGRPPSFVAGRKGRTSTVDAIVACLWIKSNGERNDWPTLSFSELRSVVGVRQGYEVSASTIRSAMYKRSDLFEKVECSREVRWQLTAFVREL